MTTIESTNNICTLINVFTVEPEKQTVLFDALREATEVMKKMPGYISANLHMGDDGTTVTNYAQWASIEDFQKIFDNPEVMVHVKESAAIATEYKPVTYHTVWSHSKND